MNEFNNEFNYAQQGWQCPICKRIYSPFTPMCYNCGGGGITKTSTSIDIDCLDEDAKQASIPYTYNAPQHDWKCGYPNITRGKEK